MKSEIKIVEKEVITKVEEKELSLTLSLEELEMLLIAVGRMTGNDTKEYLLNRGYISSQMSIQKFAQDSKKIIEIQDSVYSCLREAFEEIKK